MATIGDYRIIHDGPVTLPKTTPPNDIDHDFDIFSAPALDTGSKSILVFRVDPTGTVTLKVTLNNTEILTTNFDTTPTRTWHEIIAEDVLLPSNNQLTIERAAGDGTVTVSDVYIQFQATV
jgi:hypothetical protein